MKKGLNLCLSQRPLRSACPEGLQEQNRYHILFREQECRGGHSARYPPQKGGRTVVAHWKLRKPVKNFHTAIANQMVQDP